VEKIRKQEWNKQTNKQRKEQTSKDGQKIKKDLSDFPTDHCVLICLIILMKRMLLLIAIIKMSGMGIKWLWRRPVKSPICMLHWNRCSGFETNRHIGLRCVRFFFFLHVLQNRIKERNKSHIIEVRMDTFISMPSIARTDRISLELCGVC
jgi:hypothetical protein